jgi:hypothetical protein
MMRYADTIVILQPGIVPTSLILNVSPPTIRLPGPVSPLVHGRITALPCWRDTFCPCFSESTPCMLKEETKQMTEPDAASQRQDLAHDCTSVFHQESPASCYAQAGDSPTDDIPIALSENPLLVQKTAPCVQHTRRYPLSPGNVLTPHASNSY